MKLIGHARIGYVTSSEDYMTIEVTDETSGIEFARLKIKPEDAYALLSNRTVKGELDVRGLDLVGKRREIQRITLEIPKTDVLQAEPAIREACMEWMKSNPGWAISADDMKWNHHRIKHLEDSYVFSTHAVRFVEQVKCEARG